MSYLPALAIMIQVNKLSIIKIVKENPWRFVWFNWEVLKLKIKIEGFYFHLKTYWKIVIVGKNKDYVQWQKIGTVHSNN